MSNYYAENLHSTKLFQVYQTKYARVKRYFDEEVNFVRRELQGNEKVLEVGAGYGRIIREFAPFASGVVGIDISRESVELGQDYLKGYQNCCI